MFKSDKVVAVLQKYFTSKVEDEGWEFLVGEEELNKMQGNAKCLK